MGNLNYLRQPGIYRIRNIINGKCYIGSSCNLYNRRNSHFTRLAKGEHHTKPLQNAWNKYGKSAFVFEVIEFCLTGELITREQYHLDNSCVHLYNVRKIAESCLGIKRTEEQCEKNRQKSLGTKWTDEQRQKFSAAMKGRPKDPEHAAKVGAARRGKKWTDEQRAAISDKRKGRRFITDEMIARKAKPYPPFIAPDGTVHPPGFNLSAFCREHGLNNAHMRLVARGQERQYKGWHIASA